MSDELLEDVLAWSSGRPSWQRDALRRLFAKGSLDPEDISSLVEICKAAHGLAHPQPVQALSREHLRVHEAARSSVTLVSMIHDGGVNALAAGQTLTFGPNLTVVFGENATGKSGYTRVLKKACRARSPEEVLGNVLSEERPVTPQVSIKYRVGGVDASSTWHPNTSAADELAAISVFDAHCAPVYLRGKTDVAFRPFGLDIFDLLALACGEVRTRIEQERELVSSLSFDPQVIPDGTTARRFADTLSSLSDPHTAELLATLSEEDKKRLDHLRRQESDARAVNPKSLAQELQSKARRLDSLLNHIHAVFATFSSQAISEIRTAFSVRDAAKEATEALIEKTLTSDLLPGTGGTAWRHMWEAVAAFASEALPNQAFPDTTTGSRCPFCQESIAPATASRLNRFLEYVTSKAQTSFQSADVALRKNIASTTFDVLPSAIDLTIEELALDTPSLSKDLRRFLAEASGIQSSIGSAQSITDLPSTGLSNNPASAISEVVNSLRERAALLLKRPAGMAPVVAQELKELEARGALNEYLPAVIEAITRKQKAAAYRQCLDDTSTDPITRKSTQLTRSLITDALRRTFQDELDGLKFSGAAVEIREAGGSRGALYHQLVFTHAPSVSLLSVLSEGESRTLSLAAFFTELTTANHTSAVVFDDPVSSLDHVWRERIAHRLIREAKKRQVIVFTHDLFFLRLLVDGGTVASVPVHSQRVRRLNEDTIGVSSNDLPWEALNTRARIGRLRDHWQAADKLFRTGDSDAYEMEAGKIYADLRETWEQAVAEVLLADIVAPYRSDIQTRKVRLLHDITKEECDQVEIAMAQCSRWMSGHTRPLADGTPFPDPGELQNAILEIDLWVKTINSRRRK